MECLERIYFVLVANKKEAMRKILQKISPDTDLEIDHDPLECKCKCMLRGAYGVNTTSHQCGWNIMILHQH